MTAKPLTYAQLLTSMSGSTGLSKADINQALREIGVLIGVELRVGRVVRLPGLGVFVRRLRKGRRIRHPETRELMQLPAMTTVGFRPSKHLNKRVQR